MISVEAYRASIGLHNLCRPKFKELHVQKSRMQKRTTFNMGDLVHIKVFWLLFQLLLAPPNMTQMTTHTVPKLKLKSRKCMLLLSLIYLYILLMLHGDIETNPGPISISKPTTNHYLSTYFLNARSLKAINSHQNKLREFKELLHIVKPCIMGVSETWLTKKILNTQIATATQYNIYRKDRPIKRGGGVMLLVDAKIRSDRKLDLELPIQKHNEILVAEIEPTTGTKFIVIVAYRSQKDPPDRFMANLENTLLNCTQANYNDFLLIGDFNFSKIKWDPYLDLNLTGYSQNFMELTLRYGLEQVNKNPSTRHGNVLDLVLTNFADKLTKVYSSTFVYKSDHFLLDFAIRMQVDRMTPPPRTVWNFKRANYAKLTTDINNAQLNDQIENEESTENAWTNWRQKLLNIAKNSIPKVTVNDSEDPPWMDKAIIQHIRRKNHALKIAKDTDTPDAWKKFKKIN